MRFKSPLDLPTSPGDTLTMSWPAWTRRMPSPRQVKKATLPAPRDRPEIPMHALTSLREENQVLEKKSENNRYLDLLPPRPVRAGRPVCRAPLDPQFLPPSVPADAFEQTSLVLESEEELQEDPTIPRLNRRQASPKNVIEPSNPLAEPRSAREEEFAFQFQKEKKPSRIYQRWQLGKLGQGLSHLCRRLGDWSSWFRDRKLAGPKTRFWRWCVIGASAASGGLVVVIATLVLWAGEESPSKTATQLPQLELGNVIVHKQAAEKKTTSKTQPRRLVRRKHAFARTRPSSPRSSRSRHKPRLDADAILAAGAKPHRSKKASSIDIDADAILAAGARSRPRRRLSRRTKRRGSNFVPIKPVWAR